MQKVKVIDKKSEQSIKYERELLSRLHHPFIVNMHYAFQDYDNLYLVLDLLLGGDLRYHVSRVRKFSEEQTRFFIACLILAIEYIHSKRVIHRDIKPENLVFDDKGYVHVTDFGIAKVFSSKNSNETSGTPGYMAPEVMRGQNHTHIVDYFAIGVIGYEFMLGRRPYIGKSRKEIKEQMMAKQAQIKPEEIPYGWSPESADFINKLLQRKPELRLGFTGAHEVKEHPWLKYFPWDDLLAKKLISPYIPDKRDNYDKRYCESADKIGLETKARYEGYKNNPKYELLFDNFSFYSDENRKDPRKNNYTNNKEPNTQRNYNNSMNSGKAKTSMNSYEINSNMNNLKYTKKNNIIPNELTIDYNSTRKKRCQSAMTIQVVNSANNQNSYIPVNVPRKEPLKKSGSNTNILVNRNSCSSSSKPASPNTLINKSGYNSHRPSNSSINLNNINPQSNFLNNTKNLIYHHQHIKSIIPKSSSHARASSNIMNEYSTSPLPQNNPISHYHQQSSINRPKIPIPSSNRSSYKRAPSGYDNSNYISKINKSKTIEEYAGPLGNYNKNTPQSYRAKSNYKIANNNSSTFCNNNQTIIANTSQRKMSFNSQRQTGSYSFSRINQNNSQSSFDNTVLPVQINNVTNKNIININLNGNIGMATLFKKYKMSSCSSHSTGNSSSSKIIK